MISVARCVSVIILSLLLFIALSHSVLASPPQQPAPASDSVAALCSKADSGDSAAERRLHQFLLTHGSSDPEFAAGLDCLRSRAARNIANAQLLLAYLLEHGQGVPRDTVQAAQIYQALADRGQSVAQNNLAALYQHGDGVPRDLQKSFDLYTAAARHGNPVAQANLASMYYTGGPVPRDYSAAAHWFRAAADLGDATAQHNLGVLYFQGLGVSQDLTAAAHWEGLAAVQGNTLAQADLGYFYEKGSGVSQDYFAAYLWYSRAIAAGERSAVSRRDSIAHFLTRKQRDEGAAVAASHTSHDPLSPSTPGSLSILPPH